jgi:hypothetical protein
LLLEGIDLSDARRRPYFDFGAASFLEIDTQPAPLSPFTDDDAQGAARP